MKAGAERPENGESYLEAEGQERTKRLLTIPFPFYNASIGPGIGLGVIAQGYVQPQAGFVMAALVGQGNYSVYFDVETIFGTALVIKLPTGDYMDDKLINLGTNRFTFRPQLGVVHNRGKWSMELTGAVYLYTSNDDFFNGNSYNFV